MIFGGILLWEVTRYLSKGWIRHYYLEPDFFMMFLPAHRAASLDIVRRPNLQVDTGPAWTLWILRAQAGIAYFYGGIAKINGDWLQGEPSVYGYLSALIFHSLASISSNLGHLTSSVKAV